MYKIALKKPYNYRVYSVCKFFFTKVNRPIGQIFLLIGFTIN